MKDIECTIYAYYGVLGHEKCPSYRVNKISGEISEPVRVIVPNVVGVTVMDEPILNLDGKEYMFSEVLTNVEYMPAIRWCTNGAYPQTKHLEILTNSKEGEYHEHT